MFLIFAKCYPHSNFCFETNVWVRCTVKLFVINTLDEFFQVCSKQNQRFFIVFCLLFLLLFIFYFDLLKPSVTRFGILSLLEFAIWKTCNHKSFDKGRYNQIEIQTQLIPKTTYYKLIIARDKGKQIKNEAKRPSKCAVNEVFAKSCVIRTFTPIERASQR